MRGADKGVEGNALLCHCGGEHCIFGRVTCFGLGSRKLK